MVSPVKYLRDNVTRSCYSAQEPIQLSDKSDNFKVVIRVRPPLERESYGYRSDFLLLLSFSICNLWFPLEFSWGAFTSARVSWSVRNREFLSCLRVDKTNNTITIDANNPTMTSLAHTQLTGLSSSESNFCTTYRFTFDRVYDINTTQEEIYVNSVKEAVLKTIQLCFTAPFQQILLWVIRTYLKTVCKWR